MKIPGDSGELTFCPHLVRYVNHGRRPSDHVKMAQPTPVVTSSVWVRAHKVWFSERRNTPTGAGVSSRFHGDSLLIDCPRGRVADDM